MPKVLPVDPLMGESRIHYKPPRLRLSRARHTMKPLYQHVERAMSKLSVTRQVCTRIPTPHGDFQLCFYSNTLDNKEHLALYMGDPSSAPAVLARVHSECFTGDVLGSRRCDCGEQLDRAMAKVAEAGCGVILYLRQEGRGIGLLEKLRAYNLQDKGYDTVDANLMLGHAADSRDYTLAALMLQDLGVESISLMTNNPAKIKALESAGINVARRVSLAVPANTDNADYLMTKALRMEHMLPLNASPNESLSLKTANGR